MIYGLTIYKLFGIKRLKVYSGEVKAGSINGALKHTGYFPLKIGYVAEIEPKENPVTRIPIVRVGRE